MTSFPRLDILPLAQRQLWPEPATVADAAFVLYGGTASRLKDPQRTPDGILEVASLQDLLAHKLKVLLQRVEPKDYLDIDAMLLLSEPLKQRLVKAAAGVKSIPDVNVRFRTLSKR